MNLSFLVDLIPALYRKYVYGVLALGVAVYGVWQAAAGDWTQFVVSLITTLVGTLATANTNVKRDEIADTEDEAVETLP